MFFTHFPSPQDLVLNDPMCYTHISPSPQDLVLNDPMCFTHISPSGPSIKWPCVFYTHFTLTSGPNINWPLLLYTHSPSSQDLTGQSSCNTCPAGYFCNATFGGVVQYGSYICPEGYYCPNGTEHAEQYPCPAGTFNNRTGERGMCVRERMVS